MPLAHIYLLEGRTLEQKKLVIQKVTDALVESLGSRPDSVRVLLHDVSASDWGVAGHPVANGGHGR